MSKYAELGESLKNLTQGTGSNIHKLPMVQDEWNTRPDTVSYGMFSLDFEESQLDADDRKADRSFEGSVDLFSMEKSGAGWVGLIEDTLTEHCGACWELNRHAFEQATSLTHWEWIFRVEG